jgi:hypothetical protein
VDLVVRYRYLIRSNQLYAMALWLCVVSLSTPVSHAQTPADKSAPALTADQREEFELYLKTIHNKKIDMGDRQKAVELLLKKGWADVIHALSKDLKVGAERTTQQVIARAVAGARISAPPQFAPLMIELLSVEDVLLRQDIAPALAQYDDVAILRELRKRADDEARKVPVRVGAIHALGEYRQKKVVRQLTILMAPERDKPIRDAALAALRQLTGREFVDLEEVAGWWDDTKFLSDARWLAMLVKELGREKAEANRKLLEVIKSFKKSLTRNFDLAAEAERPVILMDMLRSEFSAVRVHGLEMIRDRVARLNKPISPELHKEMLLRLADRDASVRATSAVVFELRSDEAAARVVSGLLPKEIDPEVQTRYLKLLARVPKAQAAAVKIAMELLAKKAVREAAADLLISAANGRQLSKEQAVAVQTRARNALTDAAIPDPAMLRLIGKFGTADDADLIVRHLHDRYKQPVREAALHALDQELWPVHPVLTQLGDAALGPLALDVVARRGRDQVAMVALLNLLPKAQANKARLEEAVLAVAVRLTSADDVIVVDAHMIKQKTSPTLHEKALHAIASSVIAEGSPAPKVEPWHATAAVRLLALHIRQLEITKAKQVRERINARGPLGEAQQNQFFVLDVSYRLESSTTPADAAALTRKLLGDAKGPGAEPLMDVWLSAIRRRIAAKAPGKATAMAVEGRKIFAAKVKAEQLKQFDAALLPPKTPAK